MDIQLKAKALHTDSPHDRPHSLADLKMYKDTKILVAKFLEHSSCTLPPEVQQVVNNIKCVIKSDEKHMEEAIFSANVIDQVSERVRNWQRRSVDHCHCVTSRPKGNLTTDFPRSRCLMLVKEWTFLSCNATCGYQTNERQGRMPSLHSACVDVAKGSSCVLVTTVTLFSVVQMMTQRMMGSPRKHEQEDLHLQSCGALSSSPSMRRPKSRLPQTTSTSSNPRASPTSEQSLECKETIL